MKNYTPNLITQDIRHTLPRVSHSPQINELTNTVSSKQYIEMAHEINQLNIGNSGNLDKDISLILLVDDLNMKGIALGCLTGVHSYNGNYKKAIVCINQAFEITVDDEVYAYILTEYANLLRQLKRIDESLAVLENALNITSNEKLKWRIITIKGYCLKYNSMSDSIDLLKKASSYYNANNDYSQYLTILRHIASIYLYYKKNSQAFKLFNKVKKLAEFYSYQSIIHLTINDIGWCAIQNNKYISAKYIFTNLLKNDMTVYTKCLVLQNIAYLEFEQKNFRTSIEFHHKSLELTKEYEILEMLFEDYYKLGLAYEKIGHYEDAEKYYSDGYKQLQSEKNDIGIILLSGYRGLLLDNYIRFITNKPSISNAGIHPNTFKFTKGKSYKEMLDIFQKHLLTLHRKQTDTIKEICNNLKISMRLYFVYQDRYSITKHLNINDEITNEHLLNYIYFMQNLEWRVAVKQFDKDLYRHLLSEHHYNKSKISEILNVSLLTVIKKTANFN